MRKKTIKCLFDNVMWYILYLLPLISFIVILISNPSASIANAMSSVGLGILNDNVIFTALNSIFGVGGVFPMFVSADILLYFSYFICVFICHVAVDVLLFLVRWCHDLMSSFGGEK